MEDADSVSSDDSSRSPSPVFDGIVPRNQKLITDYFLPRKQKLITDYFKVEKKPVEVPHVDYDQSPGPWELLFQNQLRWLRQDFGEEGDNISIADSLDAELRDVDAMKSEYEYVQEGSSIPSVPAAHAPGCTEFHLFRKLPVELRCKIWTLNMPGHRLVEVLVDYDGCFGSRPFVNLHVNRESRHEAFRSRPLRFGKDQGAFIPFNFNLDTLYLGDQLRDELILQDFFELSDPANSYIWLACLAIDFRLIWDHLSAPAVAYKMDESDFFCAKFETLMVNYPYLDQLVLVSRQNGYPQSSGALTLALGSDHHWESFDFDHGNGEEMTLLWRLVYEALCDHRHSDRPIPMEVPHPNFCLPKIHPAVLSIGGNNGLATW